MAPVDVMESLGQACIREKVGPQTGEVRSNPHLERSGGGNAGRSDLGNPGEKSQEDSTASSRSRKNRRERSR